MSLKLRINQPPKWIAADPSQVTQPFLDIVKNDWVFIQSTQQFARIINARVVFYADSDNFSPDPTPSLQYNYADGVMYAVDTQADLTTAVLQNIGTGKVHIKDANKYAIVENSVLRTYVDGSSSQQGPVLAGTPLDALGSTDSQQGKVRLFEAKVNGLEHITLQSPLSLASSSVYTFPGTLPTQNNSDLVSDTAGNLAWRKRLYTSFTATSTTAGGAGDRDLLTLAVPGMHSENGMVFEFEFRGLQSQGNTGLTAKNLQAYIKINTTKFIQSSISVGVGAQTNRALRWTGAIQILTAGTTANLVAAGDYSINGITNEPLVASGIGTLDSNNPFTITIGFAYDNANAANTVTTRVGYINQQN